MAATQIQNVTIREATYKDLNSLRGISAQLRQEKDVDYFEHQFERAGEGKRVVLIAAADGTDAGYCILNWDPKYGYFRSLNIPEIQDLNVLPAFRQNGIATRMIELCETMALKKGRKLMGISFGLHAAFGPAQRLYVKMGYIPDGFGATYDRKQVSAGEFRPVDDHLCLMMVKNLS
jgi:GNAT superfamily N-acetyltransferase